MLSKRNLVVEVLEVDKKVDTGYVVSFMEVIGEDDETVEEQSMICSNNAELRELIGQWLVAKFSDIEPESEPKPEVSNEPKV